jgi:hypothetical protein
MLLRADHRPEMAHDIGVLELSERRFGNHFKGFTCRVREQVKVQPLHGALCEQPAQGFAGAGVTLWKALG